MKQLTTIILICLLNPLTLCGAQRALAFAPSDPPDELVRSQTLAALSQISRGSEEFALDIFQRLSAAVTQYDYDFIVSPFSVWSLLLLEAEGAAGNTRKQLQSVLRLPEDLTYLRLAYKHIQKALVVNTSTVELSVSQVLFSDQNRPVDIDFADKLDNVYEADHLPVNFHDTPGSYNIINQYINDKTRGKIKKIINYDDLRDAQMMMISAIYFKGQWKSPFNISQTTEEPFYDENEVSVGKVNMMFQRGTFSYTGINDLDSHVLELPYGKEDRLSMIILLPRKGVHLSSVINRLPSYGISRITAELRKADAEFEEDEVEVYIPRFSITADFTLNVILEQMGLIDIFDANKADLSKISKHSIYLSRIIHKSLIQVNEVGTVATASTGGIFANKATPPRFYANRPFGFLIVERSTNTLLFCGQVRKPGKVEFADL